MAAEPIRVVVEGGSGWITAGAALLGAVVGGFATFLSSWAIERHRRRRHSLLRRQAKIYRPLRAELRRFREGLVDEPFPHVHLDHPSWGGYQTAFLLWAEMQQDERANHASAAVKTEMDKVREAARAYVAARVSAEKTISALSEVVLSHIPESVGQVHDFGFTMPMIFSRQSVSNFAPDWLVDEARLAETRAMLPAWFLEHPDAERRRAELQTAFDRLVSQVEQALRGVEDGMARIRRKYDREPEEDP